MSLCAACGLDIPGDAELCPHHQCASADEDWAVSNRILCDFLHRGKVPARLPASQRGDGVSAITSEAARPQALWPMENISM